MDYKKTVLLTNDDGYFSKGIKLLYDTLSKIYNVIVVAPDSEKSGIGHAFSYKTLIYYEKIANNINMNGYSVCGSPADCVKFAVGQLLEKKPDLVISGLNIGENSGISAIYSGTVAAAREGALWKIDSFAFSLCEEAGDYAQEYVDIVPEIIDKLLAIKSMKTINTDSVYFNVNFPPCKLNKIKGNKITRQSTAFFDDHYIQVDNTNHFSGLGFSLSGKKTKIEESEEFDSRALLNNWVTITPLCIDQTAYQEYSQLIQFEKEIQ